MLALVLVLVLVEAMGFAYVLAGWMNMDASTNDRHLLAAATALLLAVASAFLAEVARTLPASQQPDRPGAPLVAGEEPSKRSRTLQGKQGHQSGRLLLRTLTNLTTSSCWHA